MRNSCGLWGSGAPQSYSLPGPAGIRQAGRRTLQGEGEGIGSVAWVRSGKAQPSLNSLPSVHIGLPWKGQSLQDQQRPEEAEAAE